MMKRLEDWFKIWSIIGLQQKVYQQILKIDREVYGEIPGVTEEIITLNISMFQLLSN